MEKIQIMTSPAYTVYVGEGFIRHAGICLRDVTASEKVLLLCDETVFDLYGKQLLASLRSEGFGTCAFIVKPGENAKSPSNLVALWNSLAENGFTQNDTLLSLGGGVVIDLGGFAAATYMHGLHHVIFSTTLFAMCDACVGTKNSVHLKAGKNMAGVYCAPTAVFCDTDALATLPKSIYGDGMAEIIKYGMIGSEELLVTLYGHPTQQEMIVKAINIKKDFMETNTFLYKKNVLPDLGGTLAEAAKALSGGRLSHGRAVAAGMYLTTQANVRNGGCTPATLDFLGKILDKYELPKSFPFTVRELCAAALNLKKPNESTVSLVLPEGIGKAIRKNLPADSLYDFFAK